MQKRQQPLLSIFFHYSENTPFNFFTLPADTPYARLLFALNQGICRGELSQQRTTLFWTFTNVCSRFSSSYPVRDIGFGIMAHDQRYAPDGREFGDNPLSRFSGGRKERCMVIHLPEHRRDFFTD
jgi:hypothetical protein